MTYFVGLDMGTSSVGYAVSNEQYEILNFRQKAMWVCGYLMKPKPRQTDEQPGPTDADWLAETCDSNYCKICLQKRLTRLTRVSTKG